MQLHFYKYHGTGNDFIILDNRDGKISLTQQQVANLCHRHFCIGADGLMLLETVEGYDFKMVYYNSDGKDSSMCGNGGRCLTAFAKKMGLIDKECSFLATDGPHHAKIDKDGTVHLAMQDVNNIEFRSDLAILDTGSPHYVEWVEDVNSIAVGMVGQNIRNMEEFKENGINVNFVQIVEDHIKVRTYERGVEAETMSCGTGVTACAIATTQQQTGDFKTSVTTPGGDLTISFTKTGMDSAANVVLSGPAEFVFEGDIEL